MRFLLTILLFFFTLSVNATKKAFNTPSGYDPALYGAVVYNYDFNPLYNLPMRPFANLYTYPNTFSSISIGNGGNNPWGVILQPGDRIQIQARTGGYDLFRLDTLVGGFNNWIVIEFLTGAYLNQQSSGSFNNHATACSWIKIVGNAVQYKGAGYRTSYNNLYDAANEITMLKRPEALLRFRGNGTRYPQGIWFDSISCRGSNLFVNDFTGGAAYAGDTANALAYWKITNCIFDSSYNMTGFAAALGFGDVFNLSNNCFWRDVDVQHNTFANYPSPGGPPPEPSNFIIGAVCFNFDISYNKFINNGVVQYPGGHTASVNLAISKFNFHHNYGNFNFGDDVRHSPADLWGNGGSGYLGLSRVYNNISMNKRKYGGYESRYILADIDIDSVPGVLLPWVRQRPGAEVWNNTNAYPSTGYGMTPDFGSPSEPYGFYAGSACNYDFYRADSVVAHNNCLIDLRGNNGRDTAWSSSYVQIVDFALAGPYGLVDTSGNMRVQLWTAAGIPDSTGATAFTPFNTGPLRNAGVTPPVWLTDDFYGNPRSTDGGTSIGAVQQPATSGYYYLIQGEYRVTKFL